MSSLISLVETSSNFTGCTSRPSKVYTIQWMFCTIYLNLKLSLVGVFSTAYIERLGCSRNFGSNKRG